MKRFAPGDINEFSLTIEPGATFIDVIDALSIPDSGYVFLVNGRRIEPQFCFSDGDILVLFPEISGG